jgi:hypothetical protein
MRRRRSSRARFTLGATQRKAIDAAAQSLAPSKQHSFLLRVSRTLQLSAQWPTDPQVNAAIARALAEVAA